MGDACWLAHATALWLSTNSSVASCMMHMDMHMHMHVQERMDMHMHVQEARPGCYPL